ncbi:MAG: DUF6048 family protein [Pseudoflavonifractor sp.]|nr:DUF6048 family protein [Alloprevotella sp.]MCM1116778.1 DUF6048 family protein [Pseudoflavonifractor sp.]
MPRLLCLIVALLYMTMTPIGAAAQRRVNPVKPANPGQKIVVAKPKEIDRTRLAERLDAQGNIILVDTVTGLEFVDSAAMAHRPRNLYPRWQALDIGVDIWDPVMRLLGQDYGLGSAFVRLSVHNRFFPLVEVGLGKANITPDGSNFTFKSPISPFFKIGAEYNVFYNNNPSYAFLVGLRYGFTPFKWSVDDVSVPGTYWDDPSTFTIPSQSYTAGFLEVSLGVKVKLIGPLSAGWQFKFRSIIHESNNPHGEPMYIPGFGKRGSPVSAAFSLIYTIPLNKGSSANVDNENNSSQK